MAVIQKTKFWLPLNKLIYNLVVSAFVSPMGINLELSNNIKNYFS